MGLENVRGQFRIKTGLVQVPENGPVAVWDFDEAPGSVVDK